MSNETAVTVAKPVVPMTTSGGIQLTSMEDAWRFAKAMEESGVAPKGMRQAGIFAVIQAGAELGLSPLRALANMKVINGRVGPMGALAKAMVRKANVLQKGTGFKQTFTGEEGKDDWTAHITTLRADETDVVTTSFSVKDAKRAALWGKHGPWSNYPKRMLMWRAVGFHMDDQFSEIMMGFHIAEVLEDYPEERIAATMEPVDVPAADPLLDELAQIGATMQPPGEGETIANMDDGGTPTLEVSEEEEVEALTTALFGHVELQDPIDPDDPADSEITVDGEKVDPQTGEFQAPPSQSPLESVMAEKAAEQPPMTEEEAMRDLIEEGVVKEEDLAPADPGNAAEEGGDPDLGF
jgi:hypothetical protein